MPRKISDIMTVEVITAGIADPISAVAEKMAANDIGFVPIVSDKRLMGVVTDRDLVIRGYAKKLDAATPINEVMTKRCITVTGDTSIDEASNIMAEHQIRRLCIVEDNKLIGVCAIGDLAIRNQFEDSAGQALSQISEPSKQQTYPH